VRLDQEGRDHNRCREERECSLQNSDTRHKQYGEWQQEQVRVPGADQQIAGAKQEKRQAELSSNNTYSGLKR
jgi:hypothetical protein